MASNFSKLSCRRLIFSVGERYELHPGIHQYPFAFQLPAEIPSSFDGKHGNVRYTLKAVMKRSWYKHDYICEIPITIHSVVDLNTKLDQMMVSNCN